MQALMTDGHPHQAEFRVRRPNGEVRWCASTAAATPRRRRQGRPHQRRHDGHHRPQGSRGAPGAAGARGRSSRQERDGDRAVDRAADQGGQHRELCLDHRRPDQGAVARARAVVQFALAGRRSRPAGRRGARALPLDPCGTPEHFRAEGPAGADQGADARAGAARAGHQCGEVRRAVRRVRPARGRVGAAGRRADHPLAGDGGPGGACAEGDRLRHADHHRQHRAAARRQGEVRVAAGRPALHPHGAARRTAERAASRRKARLGPQARRSVRWRPGAS